MDSLSQMMTGHLDPKEGNDGVITEECMLGNCRVSLPEDLLEDVSFLRNPTYSFEIKNLLDNNSPRSLFFIYLLLFSAA